jgi:hypothetical protein
MTGHEHDDQKDALDLDPETVRDLEPKDEDAEDVRGGGSAMECTERICQKPA